MEKRFYDIIDLFKKALGGRLSPGEEEQWRRLLEEERWRRVWEELEDGTLSREGLLNESRFPDDRGFREFRRRTRNGRASRWRLYSMMGAAAAVLVLLVNMVFSYWFSVTEETITEETVLVSQGIFPERNGARLLLGSGDTVMVADGMQVVQERGGTRVKRGDGSLAYAEGDTSLQVVYNELIVPPGAESFVILEDGSGVWLNAESRLKYPNRFAGETREVELEGEAYFEVHPDAKPFVVRMESGDVRVLGTSFCIRAYDGEEMLTTLVTGRVMYEGIADSLVLQPGEQVRVSLRGEVEKRNVDVEEYVGWRKGVYVFDRRPLEEITRDLERWYGVEVFFLNPDLKQLPFTGYVERYDKLDTFLELLESTGELTWRIEDKKIYLDKKK